MNISKPLLSALVIALALLPAPRAWSATQSVTANIAFDTPLTLTKTADINFGTVPANNASTYRMSLFSGMTVIAGTGTPLYGTTNPASITVGGSTTQTLNISVGGYTANNGVTPANATCKYGAAAAGSCSIFAAAAPGASTILLVGADAVVDGTQAANSTAAPTFTLTVVYN